MIKGQVQGKYSSDQVPRAESLPIPDLSQSGKLRQSHLSKMQLSIQQCSNSIFQGVLQQALGQVASGKCLLQESLPTPIFSNVSNTFFFFQETSSFWFLGNAENPTDLKPYWSGAGLRHPEWVCHLTGKNDQPMTNLTIYLYIYTYI